MRLVIDSNILISALLKEGKIREILVNSEHTFLVPEVVYDEIEEHKDELINKSGLSKEEFEELILIMSRYLTIVKNEKLLDYLKEAELIIGNIDKDDVPIVAASLANNKCMIWSDDKHLQKQDSIQILDTKKIIDSFYKSS